MIGLTSEITDKVSCSRCALPFASLSMEEAGVIKGIAYRHKPRIQTDIMCVS